MDSLTQIALGAAVGEAALGRRVGSAAPAWGAVLGTLPDLDVLLYPLLDPVGQLAVHRSFSHSILFGVVMAPVFGWLLGRMHARRGATFGQWTLLAWLALATHPLLDAFTVYGTQLFWPFSTYPVAFNSIFIIDPAYTLPLVVGVLGSLVPRRDGTRRLWPNRICLILSTGYLAFTLFGKVVAERNFHAAIEARGVAAEAVMTTPAPLTSLLWMGVARTADSLYVGLSSVLDDRPDDRLTAVARGRDVLAGHEHDRAVSRLRWFSKGWWAAERAQDGDVYVNDLRFGRTDGYLQSEGDYVFRFRLVPHDGAYQSFRQVPPRLRFSTETLTPLLARIRGR